MKLFANLGLAAALLLAGPSIVLAQGGNMNAGGNTNSGMGASAASDASGGQSYGAVISMVKTGSVPSTELITATPTINVVLLSSLKTSGADNAAALDAALQSSAAAQDSLHKAVSANNSIMAKLQATNATLTADDVIAIDVHDDGVNVYVDDRK